MPKICCQISIHDNGVVDTSVDNEDLAEGRGPDPPARGIIKEFRTQLHCKNKRQFGLTTIPNFRKNTTGRQQLKESTKSDRATGSGEAKRRPGHNFTDTQVEAGWRIPLRTRAPEDGWPACPNPSFVPSMGEGLCH